MSFFTGNDDNPVDVDNNSQVGFSETTDNDTFDGYSYEGSIGVEPVYFGDNGDFSGDHFSLNGFDQPEDAPMDFNDQFQHQYSSSEMDPLPQINDVVDETNRIDSPTISNLVHGSKSQSSYPPTTQSNDYISSDSSSASTSNPTSLQATPEEDFSFSTSSPKQVLQENPSDLVFEETQNVSRRPPAVDEPAVKKNTSNSNPFRDVAKVLFSNSPQQERSISSLTSTATSGTSKPQPSSASAKPPSSFFTSSTSSTSNSNAQQAGGAKMRASTVLPAPNSSSKSVNATLPLPRQSNLSNKNRPLNISSPQPTTVGAGTGAGQRKLGEAPHAPLPPLYKVPKQVTFFDNASGGAGVSGRAGGGGGGSVGGRAGSGGAGIGIAGSKRDVGGSLLGRTASSASACSANATAATPQIRPLAAGAGVGVGVGGGAAASNNKQNATGTTSTSRAASQQASFLSSRTQPSTTQQSSQPARSVTPNPKQHPAGASVGSGTRTGAASSCNHSNNSSGRGLPFFADAAKPTEEAGNVTPQTRFEETGDSGRGSDDGDAAAVEAVTPQSGGAVGGSTEWPAIIAQQQQQRQQQQPFGVGASGRQAAMQCAEADAQMAGLAERLQQAQLSLKEVKRMVVAQTVATAVAESKILSVDCMATIAPLLLDMKAKLVALRHHWDSQKQTAKPPVVVAEAIAVEQDQQQLQKGEQEKVQILSSEEEEGNGDSQQQTVGVVPVDAAAADRGKSQLVSLGCVATATPLLICWGDE